MTKYIFVNFINTWCIIRAILKMEQTCREFDVCNGKTTVNELNLVKFVDRNTHCLLHVRYYRHRVCMISLGLYTACLVINQLNDSNVCLFIRVKKPPDVSPNN